MSMTVEAMKLIAAEAQIMQAVQAYRNSIAHAKTSAANLLANWEGEAADAFAEEQAKAYQWHSHICDIVEAFTKTLKDTANRYSQAEQNVTSCIKSH